MEQMKLKRKLRNPHRVATLRNPRADWFAKNCGFGTDDQGRSQHKVAGPKTYDRTKHLLVLREGRRRVWWHFA